MVIITPILIIKKKINPKVRWTWNDYFNLIRIEFIVLDDSSLNFEWKRKIYYDDSSSWFETFLNLNPFKFPNIGKLPYAMSFLDYLIILDEDHKHISGINIVSKIGKYIMIKNLIIMKVK